MHTTFSGVESIPPTHQSSSSPRFVHSASSRRRFVQSASRQVFVESRSREAPQFTDAHVHVHVQFAAHEEHPSSRPTPQPSVPSVPRISFSTYLRRPLRYSHHPSHKTHPENPSTILRPLFKFPDYPYSDVPRVRSMTLRSFISFN